MAAVAKPHCNAGRKAALAPVPVPEIKIPNFEKDNSWFRWQSDCEWKTLNLVSSIQMPKRFLQLGGAQT
jgi:hypothetical protein